MDPLPMLAVARGDAPADLLLTGGRIVNVFSGEIEEANIAVCGDRIAGVGDYQSGREVVDLKGQYVSPGLIDGHVHLESSYLSPPEYARAVVPRGVLGVVTDFHEIANVCGIRGIKYLLQCAERLPMDVFLMAPSCVPSSEVDSSGARLDADELKEIMGMGGVLGLGEVMSYCGVIGGDPGIWAKLALFANTVMDGHAPGLDSLQLNAYLTAGISSDHECTTVDEAREKLARGMYIMIREGSSERNLEALLPLVTDKTVGRCFFVVDERDCADLLTDGGIDGVVRKAISLGLDPIRAMQMATINTAGYFGLRDLGAIAPGYRANMVVWDDLSSLRAAMVFYHGRTVAKESEMIAPIPGIGEAELRGTMNVRPFDVEALRMPAGRRTMPVIQVVPGQIVTKRIDVEVEAIDGFVQADVERDLLKLVAIERHRAGSDIGRGLVTGFGLKCGTIASSVAHDSHNIIAVGADDEDILTAVRELERMEGGIVVVDGGRVLASLPLPIAGLLSDEPVRVVADRVRELKSAVVALGCTLDDPFVALSFLSLPVIPELRLTTKGLFDVNTFKLIEEDA